MARLLTCEEHESTLVACPRRFSFAIYPIPSPRPESSRFLAGLSLSDYLLAEIREIAERPMIAESRKPVSAQIDNASLVREEREAR